MGRAAAMPEAVLAGADLHGANVNDIEPNGANVSETDFNETDLRVGIRDGRPD